MAVRQNLLKKVMNKCQSKLREKKREAWHLKNETVEKTFTHQENIPDKCVIVHNDEPLGVWDRAAQKSLKDCECFPTVACK